MVESMENKNDHDGSAVSFGGPILDRVRLEIDVNNICDESRYKNMKTHILRKTKKYNNIKYGLKCLANEEAMPSATIRHVVVGTLVNGPYSDNEEGEIIGLLESIYENIKTKCVKKIYCASIVYGENQPGVVIAPCLHMLATFTKSDGDSFIERVYRAIIERF